MSHTTLPEEPTLLGALEARLRGCATTGDGVAPPAAVLWTDPDRDWLALMPAIRKRLPELLTLGPYDPGARSGPAIWLRCVVDRALPLEGVPEGTLPILYLPGVARQELRAGEDCPRGLQPLVELMYRGTLWLQRAGRDWTLTAFLTSPTGLGLDLARDEETLRALPRALLEVAETPLEQLRGRRLEAEDFDRLLTTDLFRDVLRWMDDPDGWRKQAGEERWGAFCSQCRSQLVFDPAGEGALEAARRLGAGQGAWARAWDRFAEAPRAYPGIPALLSRARPTDLFVDQSRWPDETESAEAALRKALGELAALSHREACARVLALEKEHGERRGWVWSHLGMAPLATVLEPLAGVAELVTTTLGGSSPDHMAEIYTAGAWRADAEAWKALALAPPADEPLVQGVVRALLEPWLDESARVFQRLVADAPLPTAAGAGEVVVPEGGCLLFADGLRYDLGRELATRLEGRGCRVQVAERWSALPTVTATAKPAVTPVARTLQGEALSEDFAPRVPSGHAANAPRLRSEIEGAGYQLLQGELGDWPASDTARGWTEEGEIDRLGHKLELGLARQLDSQLDRLADRIVALLDAGWSSVRVVTDHGWLLLPGGLPKVDLPKHLTASRWSRCAVVAGESQVSVPTLPWHWNPSEHFATAPGIACFNASPTYCHGGVSIQECLIPDLRVERASGAAVRVTLREVTWRGMRCIVEATATGGRVTADLRLGQALGPAITTGAKEVDEGGRASLVVPDDAHEGKAAVLVLLAEDGTILAQRNTRVGG